MEREIKGDIDIVITGTIKLSEYERLISSLEDEKKKSEAISAQLKKWTEFLEQLNRNKRVIEMFNKILTRESKIGTAFFETYEEYVQRSKIDLINDKDSKTEIN